MTVIDWLYSQPPWNVLFGFAALGILGNAFAIFSLYGTFHRRIEDLKADLRAGGSL